jgi:colanic acid biosynthesis protein WcaH
LLIQDQQNRTLLTWRDDDFYGSGWHVPGGIIRYKEHAADRIRKVAREEIGSAVEFEPSPLIIIEAISRERERGHFISMLYRCRLDTEPDPARRAGDQPKRGEWKWHTRAPDDLLPIHRVYAQFL